MSIGKEKKCIYNLPMSKTKTKIKYVSNDQPRRRMTGFLHSSFLALGLVYLELLLQKTATNMHGAGRYPIIILIAIGTGMMIETAVGLLRSSKAKAVIRVILLEILTLWYLVAYFTDNSYRVFMDLSSIISGAKDVIFLY